MLFLGQIADTIADNKCYISNYVCKSWENHVFLKIMKLNFDFNCKVYYLQMICLEVSPLWYMFSMCPLS